MSLLKKFNLSAEDARAIAHEVEVAKHYALFSPNMKALKGSTLVEKQDLTLNDDTMLKEAYQHRADYVAIQEAKRAQEKDLKLAATFAKAIMPFVNKSKMSLEQVESKWGVAVRAAIEARQSL